MINPNERAPPTTRHHVMMTSKKKGKLTKVWWVGPFEMREESLFKSLEFLRLLSHFEKEKKNNFSIDAPR